MITWSDKDISFSKIIEGSIVYLNYDEYEWVDF